MLIADDEYGVVEEELHLDLLGILVTIIDALDQPRVTGLLAVVQQVLGLLHQGVDLPDHVVEPVVVVFVKGLMHADPAVKLAEVKPE